MLHAIEMTRHLALLAVAVTCVYTDLAWGRLYNVVTIGGIALGLATAYLLDAPGPGHHHLVTAVLAAAAGGVLLLIVYFLGGLGAGDVKLMAAVGALTPFSGVRSPGGVAFVLLALVYSALIGAAIAVGILIWQRRLWQGLKDSARAFFRFKAKPIAGAPPTTVPYGVAIGIGTIWAWLEAVVM